MPSSNPPYGKELTPNKILETFGSSDSERISVKMRKIKDVPNFINKLKTAYAKTKESSIQFDGSFLI